MKRQDHGGRGDLTDKQWQKFQPLLPPQKAHTGQPAHDHRRILNGILWLHRTGAPWDDLPARYGSRGTVSSRFYRWRSQGIWQEILNRLQQTADAANQIDWEVHYYRQYHRPRSRSTQGEQKGGTECRKTIAQCGADAPTRGTWTLKRRLIHTKIHIQAEGMGKPMQFVLTEGQHSDVKGFSTLNTALKVKRSRRGKPKQRPRYLVGDQGYDAQMIRLQLDRS